MNQAEAVAAVTRVAAVYDTSFQGGAMTYTADTPIMGAGRVSAAGIQEFFEDRGRAAAPTFAPDRTYKPPPADVGVNIVEFCVRHGLNHDMVACQIGHESAWWQSRIVRDKHNPSGLGATNDAPYENAIMFSSPREGIKATIAHLLSYVLGDNNPIKPHSVRHEVLRPLGYLGVAKVWRDLNGRWAWPGHTYAQSIASRANDLTAFAEARGLMNGEGEPMSAQIPGFQWLPAAQTHFTRGRTQSIRGYAQHYTAGTDSRAWLTHTSRPPVSSTFLIKHNPTLQDRGWQLVRIEDTAWTTAFANPYTVSCEYEHRGTGTIPDIAYTVMAQTIVDTAKYVADKQRGYIPLNREGIKGHREWTGGGTICPDGISMDRLVGEVQKLQAGDKPVSTEIELNGFKIIGGFKGRWESLGPLALSTLGYPESDEFTASVDGVERTVQLFERGILAWYPEGKPHGVAPDDPMHVRTLTLAESIALGKQWTQNARNLR